MRKILIFIFLLVSYQLSAVNCFAAAPSLTVSPSIIQLDLASSSPSAILTYTNNSKDDLELTFSSQDFTDLEDGWQVKLLEGKNAANYKYGLSSWISFDKKSLNLSPGERGIVEASIDAKNLTSGGHYATIQAEIKSNSNGQVNINGILSSLLFVRTSGGKINEEAEITQFDPEDNSIISLPDRILVRFQNSGNVDLTPYGLIEVIDPLGKTIASGILNEGSLITLPESIRKYETNLKSNSLSFLPGVYKIKIDLHFGKFNKQLTSETSFLYIGWPTIAVFLLIIVSAFLIIRKSRRS